MIALITFFAHPFLRRSLTGTQFSTNSPLIKIPGTTFYRSGSGVAPGPQARSLYALHQIPNWAPIALATYKSPGMNQSGRTDCQNVHNLAAQWQNGTASDNKQVAFNAKRWRFLERMKWSVGRRRTATAQIASANWCGVCPCPCPCHIVTEKLLL